MSSLYLAVCDRLDLPVFPVAAPRHVFLRWDDGTLRRNIESTGGGVEITDEEYAGKDGEKISTSARERGVYLQNLGKKEMLSLVMLNRAGLEREDPAEALRISDQALALWPENVAVFHTRALFTFLVEPEAESILAELDAMLDLSPEAADSHALAGAVLATRGEYEQALARLGQLNNSFHDLVYY